ncbi:MAG: hypothetical protein J2P41_22120, partial [Blastocatellia bacterium]|nr:hypothetical protein [Blastocatellia bacterium]
RQGKLFSISEAAIDLLVEKGFSPAYGARFLKRTIDEKVKLPVTNLWKGFKGFEVDVKDGGIDVRGE